MIFILAFPKWISQRHLQNAFHIIGISRLIFALEVVYWFWHWHSRVFFFQIDNAYFTLVRPFEFGNFLLDHACRITISTRITSVLQEISHDRCLHFQINRETSCYRHVSTLSQLDRMPINSEWNSYDARYINRNT